MIPTSWHSCPCIVLSHMGLCDWWVTTEVMVHDFWGQAIKGTWSALRSLTWITDCREKWMPRHKDSWASLHAVCVAWNWGRQPSAMWVHHLGSRFSSPSQTFGWMQPLCILTTGWQDTLSQNHPAMPVTHRPWAVISVCYFKPWSLGDNLSHSNR